MIELTRRQAGPGPCTCGCGGERGHVLSTERMPKQCTSLSTNAEGVLVRCRYPLGHSELVPHGDGERVWGNLLA